MELPKTKTIVLFPFGLMRGDPVRIVGGRFEGFRGAYVGSENSTQIRVQIGGGIFALRARFVKLEKTE